MPGPGPHRGDFPARPIEEIANNTVYSGSAFGEISKTLPPLMTRDGQLRPAPEARPPAPPPPPRYPDMVAMRPQYAGEDVARPDLVERTRRYRLRFGPRGLVLGRGRHPLDTRVGDSPPLVGGRAIFVMDRYGGIYASNHAESGEFHHSSLAGGQPVAAAGELRVENGRLQYVTAMSGHYWPTRVQMYNLKLELERQGVFDVQIFDHEGPYAKPPIFITRKP